MVDFVALRNQILHGEGIEPVEREPSRVEKESFQLSTGIPLFVGLSTLAFIGIDRFKLKMLGSAATPLMMFLGSSTTFLWFRSFDSWYDFSRRTATL